ncbi:MAG: hypothetical protein WD795_03755 [Woeseia sp.]
MRAFLFKWLTVVFAVTLISSFVSMMAAFVGSEGADLRDLIILQTVLIPLAVAVVIWCFGMLVRRHGYKGAFRTFWNGLPGWLLFAVFAANALVLIAELSFILIQHHTGDLRPWQEHVPAATTLFSSIALAVCYVSLRLADRDGNEPHGRR